MGMRVDAVALLGTFDPTGPVEQIRYDLALELLDDVKPRRAVEGVAQAHQDRRSSVRDDPCRHQNLRHRCLRRHVDSSRPEGPEIPLDSKRIRWGAERITAGTRSAEPAQ